MTERTSPVRVALVGLGSHGRTIQTAVEESATLDVVAVYDVNDAEADEAAKRFGCARAASYEEVLRRDGLQGVVLTTPNHLHRQQAEAAFAAGLDVFVEKPIANTVADGRAMVEAAEAAGRLLMVGHNMRFGRATQLARQMMGEGRLGGLVSVDIHFSADSVKRIPPEAWRLRVDQCPLLPVMQLGIHAIDLVHYLVSPVEEISGYAASVLTGPGVVDSVAASFRLRSGVMGTMISNYCTQVTFEYRIAGTEGTLLCTPHRVWYREASEAGSRGDGEGETVDFAAFERESYQRQMESFGRSLQQRTPPEVDGLEGLRALAVVEALDEAIRMKSRVRVQSNH